jgi:hypothetical protein
MNKPILQKIMTKVQWFTGLLRKKGKEFLKIPYLIVRKYKIKVKWYISRFHSRKASEVYHIGHLVDRKYNCDYRVM